MANKDVGPYNLHVYRLFVSDEIIISSWPIRQGCGFGQDVSVSRRTNVSSRSRLRRSPVIRVIRSAVSYHSVCSQSKIEEVKKLYFSPSSLFLISSFFSVLFIPFFFLFSFIFFYK